jgi:hypothetical protein
MAVVVSALSLLLHCHSEPASAVRNLLPAGGGKQQVPRGLSPTRNDKHGKKEKFF